MMNSTRQPYNKQEVKDYLQTIEIDRQTVGKLKEKFGMVTATAYVYKNDFIHDRIDVNRRRKPMQYMINKKRSEDGECCSSCGVYFSQPHNEATLCNHCGRHYRDRFKDLPIAKFKELN